MSCFVFFFILLPLTLAINCRDDYSCKNEDLQDTDIHCSGISSCKAATLSATRHVYCSDQSACEDATITSSGLNGTGLFCEEYVYSCASATISNVYTIEIAGPNKWLYNCEYCKISNVQYLLSTGIDSLRYSTISKGHYLDFTGHGTCRSCELSNVANLVLSGDQSCMDCVINGSGSVLASGSYSCKNCDVRGVDTIVASGSYALMSASIRAQTRRTTLNIDGSGAYSLNNAVLRTAAGNSVLNLDLSGTRAGSSATLYCYGTDKCNIYCQRTGCRGLTLYCWGTCEVSCANLTSSNLPVTAAGSYDCMQPTSGGDSSTDTEATKGVIDTFASTSDESDRSYESSRVQEEVDTMGSNDDDQNKKHRSWMDSDDKDVLIYSLAAACGVLLCVVICLSVAMFVVLRGRRKHVTEGETPASAPVARPSKGSRGSRGSRTSRTSRTDSIGAHSQELKRLKSKSIPSDSGSNGTVSVPVGPSGVDFLQSGAQAASSQDIGADIEICEDTDSSDNSSIEKLFGESPETAQVPPAGTRNATTAATAATNARDGSEFAIGTGLRHGTQESNLGAEGMGFNGNKRFRRRVKVPRDGMDEGSCAGTAGTRRDASAGGAVTGHTGRGADTSEAVDQSLRLLCDETDGKDAEMSLDEERYYVWNTEQVAQWVGKLLGKNGINAVVVKVFVKEVHNNGVDGRVLQQCKRDPKSMENIEKMFGKRKQRNAWVVVKNAIMSLGGN